LLGILLHIRQRNLVGAPKTLEPVTAHFFRSAPAFRGTEYDHRPPRPACHAVASAFLLMFPDLLNAMFNRGRHRLVHTVGV
jgi:hypothetical protein